MVKNSLKQSEKKNDSVVEYNANGQMIKLTPNIVRDYLVSGDKDRVTFQELAMFMNLCKYNNLNPWLKEAYCIKYGNEPATMVTGKEAFEKRAESHPDYDGDEAGIIVFDEETGEIEKRVGTLVLPGEKLIGGYAEVWRKGRSHSTRIEVSFDEYAGRKKDGTLNRQWSAKPATMIRKVALVQALREAFPTTFGGMYTAEEQEAVLPDDIVIPDSEPATPQIVEQEQAQEPAMHINEKNDIAASLFGNI